MYDWFHTVSCTVKYNSMTGFNRPVPYESQHLQRMHVSLCMRVYPLVETGQHKAVQEQTSEREKGGGGRREADGDGL